MSKPLRAISDYIPYSSLITPEIIKIQGGSYMMNFRLKGINYIGQAQEIIDARVIQINNFIGQLRAPYRYNLYLQTHCIRAGSGASLPSAFATDSFAAAFNHAYEQKIIYEQPIIATDYYISVIYRPYVRIGGFSAFKSTRAEIIALAKQAEETLNNIKEAVLSYFDDYDIELLSCYEKDGVLFSEQLRFLNYLCNLNQNAVPVQRAQISEYLPTATISIGNNEYIKIENNGITRYGVIMTFAEYPEETSTGMLQKFLEMPWQMTVTQTFAPIDKAEARDWLTREYNRLQNTDSGSETDLQDLYEANQAVSADQFLLGDFYWSVMLIDDSPEKLKRKLSEADAILSSAGFRASVNKIAKVDSYFAQLPANIALQPRKAKLSSANCAQMMPFQKQNHGKRLGNAWGAAVAMLRTHNEEVYYFNFHDPEKGDSTGKDIAGNTFISGATGTGKTVLVSFLLAQSQRYAHPPKIVMFDKDLGSSVFVRAMGGKYSQIKLGEPTGFNPFHLKNTATNRTFIAQLIKSMLHSDQNPITAEQDTQIESAIMQVMSSSDQSLMDIEAFANLLPSGDDSIQSRLKKWTCGQYAWVFNNREDNFSTNEHILGIDYTQFLDNEEIRTPILMYLFHRIQEMLDGTPLIITLDEAWKPLKDPMFQAYLEDKQRTIRKERGLLVFASQSPADAYLGLSHAFLEQIATHIFLPNPRATRDVYVEHLGLEEEEFELIKNLGKHSREFLVKHQAATAHCKLSLSGIKEVEVMSGSASKSALADSLIQEYGDDWLNQYYVALANKKDQIINQIGN